MPDLLKKLDVQGVVDNIKSIINPNANTPKVDPDDAIGVKIAELSTLVQKLSNAHTEQAKELAHVNRLLNGLFKDIETLRTPKADQSSDSNKAGDEKNNQSE